MSSPAPRAQRLTLDMGARQLAKSRTRERICAAARDLFTNRGWTETTTQLIAAGAGVAVGTIFQHASDKEDLLLLVLHDPLASAITSALARPTAAGEVLTGVTMVFGALLDVHAELGAAAAPAVRAAWFGNGPNARAVQWLHETLLDQVAARLERAQQAGALAAGADARMLADNLSAIYRAVLLEWISGDDDVEVAVARLRASFALQIIPLQTTTPGGPA